MYSTEQLLKAGATCVCCDFHRWRQVGKWYKRIQSTRLHVGLQQIISTFFVQAVMYANRIKNPGCSDEDQLITHLSLSEPYTNCWVLTRSLEGNYIYAIVRRTLTTHWSQYEASIYKKYLQKSANRLCSLYRSASIESAKYLCFLWIVLSIEIYRMADFIGISALSIESANFL